METQNIALILYTFLLSGYVVLDGFDLGIGVWYPFLKSKNAKKLALRAIGMPWDGNEVWLFTGGGILFAGAPRICSMIFSAFIHCWVLVLVSLAAKGLIVNKLRNSSSCDCKILATSLSAVSTAIAFGIGFITGQLIIGIPVDVFGAVLVAPLLSAIPVFSGFISVALFMLHGICKLALDADEDLGIFFSYLAMKNSASLLALYLITLTMMYTNFEWTIASILSNVSATFISVLGVFSILMVYFHSMNRNVLSAFNFSYLSILAPLLSISIISLPNVYELANSMNHDDVIGVCRLDSEL